MIYLASTEQNIQSTTYENYMKFEDETACWNLELSRANNRKSLQCFIYT